MIILIDGYNVLKQMRNTMITESERRQFINQLGTYAAKKSHKIVLVFDAGPHDRPVQERISGIYVVYSGTRETADDYIREYINTHKSHDMILITSDRELRRHAGQNSIDTFDPLDFYHMLSQSLSQKPISASATREAVKTSAEGTEELDKLMAELTKGVPHKHEDSTLQEEQRVKAQQISKKERRILKKIKKL